jgi:long-chain acyl-CoA synthetase
MSSRTLVDLVLDAARGPSTAALVGAREASSGLTAADLDLRSAQLAAALATYGLEPGARAAILTADGAEAVLGLLAILRAGGTAVPLDPGTTDAELAGTLLGASVRQILVSDDMLLARIQRIRPELPELDLVLLFREPGENRAAALSVAGACAAGAAALAGEPGLVDDRVPGGARAPAILRAAAWGDTLLETHENLLAAAEAAASALRIERGEMVFSALPATDAAHLALALACLGRGARLAHAIPADNPGDALVALRPTLAVVPRSFSAALKAHLETAVGARGWLGGKLLRFALGQGEKRGSADLAAGRLPTGRSLGWRVAEALVVRRIAKAAGGRLSRMVSLGEPLPSAESGFFLALGLPFLEGLAFPEAAGFVSVSRTDALRPGTAGPLVPGLEARAGATGVLELRGPMVAGDGWRRVPFRGHLDGDGYLTGSPLS